MLLDCSLSRGGGYPPFAIEFAGSCEATRYVNQKGKTNKQIADELNLFDQIGVWRSFRDWFNVLTPSGLDLLPNWLYWWKFSHDPLKVS